MDAVKFATQIMSYCQVELGKIRRYTNHEISFHFLKELDSHAVHVQAPLKALEDLTNPGAVPESLLFTTRSVTFGSSQARLGNRTLSE
jgi:hypothetical protein